MLLKNQKSKIKNQKTTLVTFFLLFLSFSVGAQIHVNSSGNVGIKIDASSSSALDVDDSNPNYGSKDTYGNLIAISQPYQYPSTEVSSTETWTSDLSTCGDVVVSSTGNLTINGAKITLEGINSFEVTLGGELIINEGSII